MSVFSNPRNYMVNVGLGVVCTYVGRYVCMYWRMDGFMCGCMYVYVHICMYEFMDSLMHVCIHVCFMLGSFERLKRLKFCRSRGKSIQVHAVLPCICSLYWSAEASEKSHWWKTIQVQGVFESLCALNWSQTTHAHSHWREALQMLALLQGFLSVRLIADTFTYPLQRCITEERHGSCGASQKQYKKEVN